MAETDDYSRPRPSDGPARAAPVRRKRQRGLVLAGALIASAPLVATIGPAPRPRLLWNASASSPVGLYSVSPVGRPRVGDIVIAWPPPETRQLAARRHYLPLHIPLVKPVAAVAGDRVCARGALILVNGRPAVRRKAADRRGRRLPWWTGCHRLVAGEILLLSAHVPGAFDGRYFGISRRDELVGRARLRWAGPTWLSGHG